MTGPIRRATAKPDDGVLNYAQIGATQSPEIINFPPRGFRAFQQSHRLGSGQERYDTAVRSLMTWGVHRNSGIPIVDIARESESSSKYEGVDFDPVGKPVGPTGSIEQLFGPDGTPYVTAGTTAAQVLSLASRHIKAPIKVVYTIDEPNRTGFAYGSRIGHPMQVEQLMVVDLEPDGGVWLTIRSISRAGSAKWRVPLALYRLRQKKYSRRFVTALHPARQA